MKLVWKDEDECGCVEVNDLAVDNDDVHWVDMWVGWRWVWGGGYDVLCNIRVTVSQSVRCEENTFRIRAKVLWCRLGGDVVSVVMVVVSCLLVV